MVEWKELLIHPVVDKPDGTAGRGPTGEKWLPFPEVFCEERGWTEAKHNLEKLYFTASLSRI